MRQRIARDRDVTRLAIRDLDIIEAWAVHLNYFEGSCILGSSGGIRLDPFSFHTNVCDMELDATLNLDQANGRWHDIRENADAYDSSQHHWIAAGQDHRH